MILKKDYNLSKFTTMGIGGKAGFFCLIKTPDELREAIDFAKKQKLPWYVVGEGSNLVVSDQGFPGLVIQNQIKEFQRTGQWVTVGAGDNLLRLIFRLNRLGLKGLERMAGIPGTVGGAIYGAAGAYGQEIKDVLVKVKFFDGKKIRILTKKECRFAYRGSIFKKNKNWIITEAVLKLRKGGSGKLLKISKEIIKLREKKYRPGLKCPGSFFKNIKLGDIKPIAKRKVFLQKIDQDHIMYGKVPAGYLLEQVGAKGMKLGTMTVASHHANLIYNPNGGRAWDVARLAKKLKALVKSKFGITIEEEVQYLPR